LVLAAVNSGARFSDGEAKKVKKQAAAKARASKDKDSPVLDAIIGDLMRQVAHWRTRTPYHIAGEILDDVNQIINQRKLRISSKGELSRDAVRKRVLKLKQDRKSI
jgi:hypothetical protein